jgi:general secretion pathway protein D
MAATRDSKPNAGFRLALLLSGALAVAGCETTRPMEQRAPTWATGLHSPQEGAAGPDDAAQIAARLPSSSPPPERPDTSFYRPGTGQLIGAPGQGIAEAVADGGEIKLNFQNANLLEVVKVILGDMLNATYVVDPRVQGAVTMQTSRPLPRSALLPTLELLLRMNDAALIMDGNVHRIVPVANAVTGVRAPQLGDSALPLPRGYSVRVVPLKYVAADEMAQILEPFVAQGENLLRTDSKRNVIILAGSSGDMARMLEIVRVFDVDRMKGMSVGMFTPDFVDAKTLGEELEQLLADQEAGLMAGLVRFIVIERLNGLMAVTPRPEYLAQVRSWVERLDRESGGAGSRLFIYRVHNSKATELADVLNQLFESQEEAETPAARLAPGLQPATARTTRPPTTPETPEQPEPSAPPAAAPAIGEGVAISSTAKVRVIADEPNNTLLILASTQEYRQILTALRQLDAVPLQVLIEVTIAEVSLTNNLEYGVEWFFKNKVGEFGGRGILDVGLTDFGAAGIGGGGVVQGFSYALTKGNDVVGLLNLLDRESEISIISSPSLLVLNNQEARIQVGDEISIKTAEQSTVTVDDTTALNSTFERRETGVLLSVKPRVNPGGLVIMDVEQEVSNVPQDDVGTDNPRIQKRNIKSSVAVQSGDSVLLGGLMKDNRDRSEAGLPGLHKLPLFGPLFGTKSNNLDRTELLVLITPRAIPDRTTALQVTEEFRRKVQGLSPIADSEPAAGSDAAAGAPTTAQP